MKIKIRQNKKAGEFTVNFIDSYVMRPYRFGILKGLTEGKRDVTLVIDTNQCIIGEPVEKLESYLKQSGNRYKINGIGAYGTKFFGVNINFQPKKKIGEKLIIFDIDSERFSQELFNMVDNYDIGIGINRKKPFEETCEVLMQSVNAVLFNNSFFEESIYDSVLCSSLRSSSDIKKAEAIINEMGV